MISFVINTIGIIGMCIILANLFFLETSRVKPKSPKYLILSLIGSLFLTLYSYILESHIFTVVNIVFVLLNGYWLFKLKHKRKTPKSNNSAFGRRVVKQL